MGALKAKVWGSECKGTIMVIINVCLNSKQPLGS
jgi:hypothetical protein